jgi:hypothetical protein
MKTTKFLAIIALLSLVSCVNQSPNEVEEPNIAKFYPYNPADTINNPYYHNLLMVDSTRVFYKEIRDSHPISNSNEYSKKYEDSLYAAEAKIWLSIMDMASKKKWEECLRLYEKNHVPLYYVLENSLVMFNADYHVFSEIMYDYYPEAEADAINLKLFEEDFWITSYAMYSDDDYFPDHYEELTRFLSQLYAKLGKRGKALEMAEIYKDVLSDLYDKRDVEHLYLNHMSELYLTLKDYDNALKSLYSYRECVIKNIDDENTKVYYLHQIDDLIERTRQKKSRADSASTKWMSYYTSYINDNIDTSAYTKSFLCYIDDDDIPELCLFGTCFGEGAIILSQYKGDVSEYISYWSPHYIERSGLIDNGYGHHGSYGDHIIQLKNGIFKEILHTEAIWHDGTPPYFVYTINEKVIDTLYGADKDEDSCPQIIEAVNQAYFSKGMSLDIYDIVQ